MKKHTTRLKGSALTYAILFVLILSLICAGLLSVLSVQQRQASIFQTRENLYFDSKAALQYANLEQEWKGDSLFLVHSSGDTSIIKRRKWGMYLAYAILTKKGTQSLKSNYLLGRQSTKYFPSLVLFGSDQGLKITGTTKLEGSLFLPKGKIERTYIDMKKFEFDKLFDGDLSEVKNDQWKLNENLTHFQFEINNLIPHPFLNQATKASFFNPTQYFYEITPIGINTTLEGNIIVKSEDSIFIAAKSNLDKVCIISPIIHIEKGFKGNVQLFASQKIVLEDSVTLTYPSTIFLNSNEFNTSQPKVEIGKKSTLLGGILMSSSKFDIRKPPLLIIREKTKVAGLIYNVGTTELYGSVYGHLFSGLFQTNIGAGVYINTLVDVTISSYKTPARFGIPDYLNSQKKFPLIVLSCKYEK